MMSANAIPKSSVPSGTKRPTVSSPTDNPHYNIAQQRRNATIAYLERASKYGGAQIYDVGAGGGGLVRAAQFLQENPGDRLRYHAMSPLTCPADEMRCARIMKTPQTTGSVVWDHGIDSRITGCHHTGSTCDCRMTWDPPPQRQVRTSAVPVPTPYTGVCWLFVHSFYYIHQSDLHQMAPGDRVTVIFHPFYGDEGNFSEEYTWKRLSEGGVRMSPVAKIGNVYEHDDITGLCDGFWFTNKRGVKIYAHGTPEYQYPPHKKPETLSVDFMLSLNALGADYPHIDDVAVRRRLPEKTVVVDNPPAAPVDWQTEVKVQASSMLATTPAKSGATSSYEAMSTSIATLAKRTKKLAKDIAPIVHQEFDDVVEMQMITKAVANRLDAKQQGIAHNVTERDFSLLTFIRSLCTPSDYVVEAASAALVTVAHYLGKFRGGFAPVTWPTGMITSILLLYALRGRLAWYKRCMEWRAQQRILSDQKAETMGRVNGVGPMPGVRYSQK